MVFYVDPKDTSANPIPGAGKATSPPKPGAAGAESYAWV
jgi:hypothetical protein